MHRRSLRSRASSLLALLLVVLGSPMLGGWARPCPHADDAPHARAADELADAVWFCGKRTADAGQPSEPGESCTCVGPCHVTPAILPPSAPALPLAVTVEPAVAPRLGAGDAPRARIPHALPFANAPPSLL